MCFKKMKDKITIFHPKQDGTLNIIAAFLIIMVNLQGYH